MGFSDIFSRIQSSASIYPSMVHLPIPVQMETYLCSTSGVNTRAAKISLLLYSATSTTFSFRFLITDFYQ